MEMTIGEVGKTCPKCGHKRTSADPGPEYECPKCGVIYAKAEAALRAKEAAALARAPAHGRPRPATWDAEPELRAQRAHEKGMGTVAHVVYGLYVLPVGLTALIGVIIAHVMRGKAAGTWVESHFRWQTGTFWGAVLSTIVVVGVGSVLFSGSLLGMARKGSAAGATASVGVAGLIGFAMLAIGIWCIYRVAKGWIRLIQSEEVD